jgi:GntR family transcriptional repressor for pyruvate dehydrogenase complex
VPAKRTESPGRRSGFCFESLGRKKAYEEVADQIRARIFAQQLRVRDLLPTERELAEQFGVSRVVIREAIRTLETAGFLTVRKGPKGGIFVAGNYDRPISESILNLLNAGEASLQDLFQIRQLIEPFAASRAAALGTQEEFQELEEIVKKAEAQSANGDSVRSYNLDFHRRIIRMGRNPILTAMGETVLVILAEQIKNIYSPETSRKILSAHKEIVAAISCRDVIAARETVAADISTVSYLFGNIKTGHPRDPRQDSMLGDNDPRPSRSS